MTRTELIERLEKASGPDRKLDAIIAYVTKPALARYGSLEEWLATDASKKVAAYTLSIDDALTLVRSKGWQVGMSDDGKTPYAFVGRDEYKHGAMPAIAICIAALRS